MTKKTAVSSRARTRSWVPLCLSLLVSAMLTLVAAADEWVTDVVDDQGRGLSEIAVAFDPAKFCARAFYPCYGMAEVTLLVTGGRGPDALRVLSLLDVPVLLPLPLRPLVRVVLAALPLPLLLPLVAVLAVARFTGTASAASLAASTRRIHRWCRAVRHVLVKM